MGIAQEMERDPSVVLIGEDVGAAGGVFKLTEGLFETFGPERVVDTPISEQAIVGAAMGAAMTGLRPVAELMFSDFFAVTWDMVANQIAKTRYMTDGQVSIPLVIRTANGAGLRFGAQHSQSVENWAMAIPGLKVVAPSTPADVVGLMAAAIRDPDPVIFCEHKGLFATKGEVPDGEHVVPLGKAAVLRAGRRRDDRRDRGDGPAGPRGGDRLDADHGIDAEVIDLRSLVPLDVATILHRSRRRAASSPSRRTRGSAAGAPRSPRSSPTRASTASTPRSSGSRRRTSRCRAPPRSRTPRSRTSSGSSTPSADAWRPRSDDRRRRRDGPDGLRDDPCAARRRTRRPRLQPDPRGPTSARSRPGRRSRRRPRTSPRAPTSRSRCSPTMTRSATSTAGRLACSRERMAGAVLVDLSTVTPDTIRSLEADARATGSRDPRRAGLGQRHARPVGPADAHGRRHGRGPRAGAAGPRAAREDDRPRRPARLRGGDEARGQHRDLRVERGRSRRGSSSPRRRGSTERSPTASSPTARSARRTSGTSGRPSSRPTRRPSRSPSTWRRRTSG